VIALRGSQLRGYVLQILIVRNNSNTSANDAAFMLAGFLSTQGIDPVILNSDDLYAHRVLKPAHELHEIDFGLAVVLGGDGTILRTARLLAGKDTPILGINFGHLGFLANPSDLGVIELTSRALAGELLCESRTNLSIDVVCDDDAEPNLCKLDDVFADATYGVNTDGRDGVRNFFALNELAATRGAFGRTLDLSLEISDTHIANISGDGALVASATGSSAYSLAAGGPLASPGYAGLIVQPIAPHTLTSRAIMTDANDVVRLTFPKNSNQQTGHDSAPTLFADGDMLLFDRDVIEVTVRRGSVPTKLMYASREHFYNYAAETFFDRRD
jgi:NAD+ kinase